MDTIVKILAAKVLELSKPTKIEAAKGSGWGGGKLPNFKNDLGHPKQSGQQEQLVNREEIEKLNFPKDVILLLCDIRATLSGIVQQVHIWKLSHSMNRRLGIQIPIS